MIRSNRLDKSGTSAHNRSQQNEAPHSCLQVAGVCRIKVPLALQSCNSKAWHTSQILSAMISQSKLNSGELFPDEALVMPLCQGLSLVLLYQIS